MEMELTTYIGGTSTLLLSVAGMHAAMKLSSCIAWNELLVFTKTSKLCFKRTDFYASFHNINMEIYDYSLYVLHSI